jgi:23S rRNA (pseudouridine1915-N3)-methyltransferase
VKIVLLRVGRGKTTWADEATADFSRRLGKALPFEERLLKPEPYKGDRVLVRRQEGARIRAAIKNSDRLVLLDERGAQPTTEGLAEWRSSAHRSGVRRLVFAIGGPYGHDPLLRSEAWRVLALSKMVLNHELARVVLVEQLYRVSTILWGGQYHH